MTLRRTTLRDIDGVVHTIPNREIKVASDRTRVWARINENVVVAYDTDIDRAMASSTPSVARWRTITSGSAGSSRTPRVERVEALGEYGVTLKILGSVRATEQWAAGGELRKRLLRKRLLAALQASGIETPRPQRVVFAQDQGDRMGPARTASAEPGPTEDDLAEGSD